MAAPAGNSVRAAFGGGCFWGMEKWFRKQFPQLLTTAVGYMGGSLKNPTYKQVCSGDTGHAEVLYLEYDPAKTKYRDLLSFFWRVHDPTTPNRQGNDVGTQYRSAVFFYTPEQEAEARQVKTELEEAGKWKNIVTEIAPASQFYRGEDYHQLYLDNNPNGYCNHRPRW